jgi:hypothetical protein
MNKPNPAAPRPRSSDAERWEYILMAGTNRIPEPRTEVSPLDRGLRLVSSPKALGFLSAVLAAVALAPQTPGAHNWAAERAGQQSSQPVAATGAGIAP